MLLQGNFTWELVADRMKQPKLLLPDELNAAQSIRSNGQRMICVQYAPVSDCDASDAETAGAKTCDPCVTCGTVRQFVGDLHSFEAKDGSLRA